MAFDLESWSLDDAKELADFYNEQITDVPLCYSVVSELDHH